MTQLELGGRGGCKAPAGILNISRDRVKNSTPKWFFAPTLLTSDAVSALLSARALSPGFAPRTQSGQPSFYLPAQVGEYSG